MPLAFFYLENCLSVALNNAQKDRDESLDLQKKEELDADRAMTADMGPGADERRGKKNEMEADRAITTDMGQGADERRFEKNEMAERKRKKEELEANRAMATDTAKELMKEEGKIVRWSRGRERSSAKPGADERRVKKNEMSQRKRKKHNY